MDTPSSERRRFSWPTFWTAVSSVAAVAAVVVTVLLQKPSEPPPPPFIPIPLPFPPSPSPSPSTSVVPPSLSVSTLPPRSFSDAGLQLKNSLWNGVFRFCFPRRDLEGGAVDGAIECTTAMPGPAYEPLIKKYSDGDAMARDFESLARLVAPTGGNCALGQNYVGTWFDRFGRTKGRSQCYYEGNLFTIVWTYDSDNVLVVAQGSSNTLFSWWQYASDNLFHQ